MPKILGQTKKGFTIIEVVLVLAIAGLIFLMVFLALPALQRSQRDTQRRDDLARFQTAIANYQTNNRGKIPGNGVTDNTASLRTAYSQFLINYLWAGGDEFVDPDGNEYVIGTVCSNLATNKPDANVCQSLEARTAAASANNETITYDGDVPTVENLTSVDPAYGGELNHRIYVFQNAQCEGESVIASTGVRKIAIQYKLEGGGVYCGNN
ncbi:type II secretion system protein [Candidatus Saccharibacteria bacterium]|nr:type II secretion system protein [Candidatus Saccharibacteria bacterium]